MYNLVWSAIFVISTSWIWDVFFLKSGKGRKKKKKRLEFAGLMTPKTTT